MVSTHFIPKLTYQYSFMASRPRLLWTSVGLIGKVYCCQIKELRSKFAYIGGSQTKVQQTLCRYPGSKSLTILRITIILSNCHKLIKPKVTQIPNTPIGTLTQIQQTKTFSSYSHTLTLNTVDKNFSSYSHTHNKSYIITIYSRGRATATLWGAIKFFY